MKKLLPLFLLLFSINGYCEWTLNAELDGQTNYFDYSTKKVRGNFVRIWSLSDSKKPSKYQNMTYLSSTYQYEFDCENDRVRILSGYFYSQSMGSGKVLDMYNGPKDWIPIPPNSFFMSDLKKVCRGIN